MVSVVRSTLKTLIQAQQATKTLAVKIFVNICRSHISFIHFCIASTCIWSADNCFFHVKAKFYRFVRPNAILYRAKNASTELVCMHLLKSVCLPASYMLLRFHHLLKKICLCWTTLIEQFIVYLDVLAQRTFSFLNPCLTGLVLASLLMRDWSGLWDRFLAVSRGLLCSVCCSLLTLTVGLWSYFYYYFFNFFCPR